LPSPWWVFFHIKIQPYLFNAKDLKLNSIWLLMQQMLWKRLNTILLTMPKLEKSVWQQSIGSSKLGASCFPGEGRGLLSFISTPFSWLGVSGLGDASVLPLS
jgi:hypothetical protein